MKPALINSRYKAILPDHLADWDGITGWEEEKFCHMEQNLKQGDILLDVGTEFGWNSAVYAQFVGAENMCLFEPSPIFWVSIRLTWEANHFHNPLRCWAGLIGEETTTPEKLDYADEVVNGFPMCAWFSDEEETTRAYRYIKDHAHNTKQITIDDWCEREGILPDAITIDIEGFELSALRGAAKTLTPHGVKVWCSLHPDLIRKVYGFETDEEATNAVLSLMESYGYKAEFIAVDHETHYFFQKG